MSTPGMTAEASCASRGRSGSVFSDMTVIDMNSISHNLSISVENAQFCFVLF